jgi:hypothetical protein
MGMLALAVAIGIIFGARKFSALIGAPLWYAKFLFICASLAATYFLAEAVIPEKSKPVCGLLCLVQQLESSRSVSLCSNTSKKMTAARLTNRQGNEVRADKQRNRTRAIDL